MQNAQYAAQEVENFEPGQPDRLFGICQAAGEDLGINPFLLRVGIVGLLFFGPVPAIGTYVGLGLLVGASRLLFPKPEIEGVSESELSRQPLRVVQNERQPELIAA